MKKGKFLLLLIVVMVLMPVSVLAKGKINVYLFKGEGCGYCAKALTFFKGLDSEYKSYFELVEKEVWNSKTNATLMQEVANSLGIEVKGVPLIVIGDKTIQGYSEEYNDQIKDAIKTAYQGNENGTYVDKVAPFIKDGGSATKFKVNDVAITIVVVVAIISGVIFLVYMALDNVTEVKKEEIKEEKIIEEIVVEEPKKVEVEKVSTTVPKKTTTKKKTSTTKKTSNAKKSSATKKVSAAKKSSTGTKKVSSTTKKTTTSAKRPTTTKKKTRTTTKKTKVE